MAEIATFTTKEQQRRLSIAKVFRDLADKVEAGEIDCLVFVSRGNEIANYGYFASDQIEVLGMLARLTYMVNSEVDD